MIANSTNQSKRFDEINPCSIFKNDTLKNKQKCSFDKITDFETASAINAADDDNSWEIDYIDRLVRSNGWNELVKHSTTHQIKTPLAGWTVHDRRQK